MPTQREVRAQLLEELEERAKVRERSAEEWRRRRALERAAVAEEEARLLRAAAAGVRAA
jgi:hypothetical protein